MGSGPKTMSFFHVSRLLDKWSHVPTSIRNRIRFSVWSRHSTGRFVLFSTMSVVITPSALTSFQLTNLSAFTDVATKVEISPSLTSPLLAPYSVWVVRFRK